LKEAWKKWSENTNIWPEDFENRGEAYEAGARAAIEKAVEIAEDAEKAWVELDLDSDARASAVGEVLRSIKALAEEDG
jgi:hypothetical protein